LVFGVTRERPEYVPWSQAERIDFELPVSTPPAIGRR
jgi:hypothetical protein